MSLLGAIGLVLVIEGLMPLLSPVGWRETMRRIGMLRDGQIRFIGLASILAGAALVAFSD